MVWISSFQGFQTSPSLGDLGGCLGEATWMNHQHHKFTRVCELYEQNKHISGQKHTNTTLTVVLVFNQQQGDTNSVDNIHFICTIGWNNCTNRLQHTAAPSSSIPSICHIVVRKQLNYFIKRDDLCQNKVAALVVSASCQSKLYMHYTYLMNSTLNMPTKERG